MQVENHWSEDWSSKWGRKVWLSSYVLGGKNKENPLASLANNLHLVKEHLHTKFHNVNILFNESYAIFPLNASEYSMGLGLFNSTLYALE